MTNKNFTRFFSFMLTVLMLVGLVPVSAIAEDAVYKTILADTPVSVTLDGVEKTEAVFKFVPEETATYVIYSYSNDHDTYGHLYDSDMEEIEYSDDDGEGANFKIIFDLTAGDTYYIKGRFYSTNRDGQFYIAVSKGVPATGIMLDIEENCFEFDYYYFEYDYELTPINALPESVTFTSSDESVLTVNEYNEGHTLKAGEVVITATSENGLKCSTDITVEERPVLYAGIPSVVKNSEYVYFKFTVEETGTYRVSTNGSDTDIYLYLSNAFDNSFYDYGTNYPGSDDEYIIKELQAGEQYILTCENYSSTASIEVILENLVEATGVTVDVETCIGEEGHIIYPKVRSVPSNSHMEDYTITVEDGTVAGVHGNYGVGLLKEGTTQITVTTTDGFTATATVTVIGHKHTIEINAYDEETHDIYCETCDFTDYGAKHDFTDGVCICGYFEHDHVTNYFVHSTDDDDEHYSVCSLCLLNVYEDHDFNDDDICNDCGYEKHEHTSDYSEFDHYDDSHGYYCTVCGYYMMYDHEYDEDGKCVCGDTKVTEHECNGDKYKGYVDYHVVLCSVCDDILYEEYHTPDERGICVCGIACGEYDVVNIGNIGLLDGEYLDTDGNITTDEPDKWAAHFENGVLTLNDISVRTTGENHGIYYYYGDLDIVVNGYARIESDVVDSIRVDDGDLNITGEGTLEVIAHGNCDAIDSDDGSVIVDGPVILIYSGDNGIEADYEFVMTSGTLMINADDDGIDADDITIFDGNIYICAEDNGIDSSYITVISGGRIDIKAKTEYGIEAGEKLEITGGYISVVADDNVIYVYDIEIDSAYGEIETVYNEEEECYNMVDGDEFVTEYIFTTETYDNVITSDMVDISENIIYVMNGSVVPEITVTGKDGNLLTEGTDYTVTLSDDKLDKPGVYYAVIEGKGSYSGTEYVSFVAFDNVVYVSGVELHAGDYLATGADSATGTKPANGGYAYFDGETLELNNYDNTATKGNTGRYDVNGTEYDASVYSHYDITVKLVGKNTIVNSVMHGTGIASYDILEFVGNGTVDITADYGIESINDNVEIRGGTINITAREDGICTYNDAVFVYGGNINVNAGDSAIYSSVAIIIAGGTVNTEGYIGLESTYIEINGGIVNLSGEYAVDVSEDSFYINGGYAKLFGYFSAVHGYGDNFDINIADDMMIHSDSEVNIKKIMNHFVLFGEDGTVNEVIFAADFENTVYGDANCDGKTNLGDASLILKKIAKWKVTLNDITSDVNADGKINLGDVSLLLKVVAGWDVTVGPEGK